ncbi:MAG: NADH-quinone oxidoreductase subunit M [Candidatus Bathyarchaeota archaeon]|jgi:NADH-quinone oxidoreductase subunit M|nr:NADH-quinone oxidoreductase subunit M [Candidatus Bathyarchaeota archaeon A05DMB-5]MDH7558283.1 NADH-quinone oxidoreductase subunit M [Candidatus Bathyarchaeota archaeon]
MENTLLLTLLLPTLAVPFVYLLGRKSSKTAAFLVALICIINIAVLSTTVPSILNGADHKYVESYYWIPVLHSSFTLFVDGISFSMAIITLILILTATLFSINYMQERKGLAEYYALLTLLSIGLVGVFITSNLMLFYFCWELMLVPTYFIIGGWGYREPYRAAFKFFIFTHAGAVFVLLGIGAIFMVTGDLDMFQAQTALMTANPELVKWILLSLTAGFAVKMAAVPVHMWLPDAHSEAPAPMSALLSGVIISAGAYAILRVSLGTVFPAVMATDFGSLFLHGLTIFGILSAFFGSLIALVETDIKRIIAYSSIAHMGYVLFGLSLFPFQEAITGTVLHLINHAVSKGLLFLSAGAVMKQLEIRDIREMGGLAGQMPITATSSTTAALSIAGIPPFACFISEFLIFVGAFQTINNDNFYLIPTALMLIATVLSLAYALRFVGHVFLGSAKHEKITDVPFFMKLAMIILTAFVIVLGIWPTFFIQLITSVTFI